MKNKNKSKTILHIDGDSFFASCEVSLDPSLRGRPVVTGHERGIATAMSKEAKALGVFRGMPIFQIKKEFPQVVVVSSNYFTYGLFAERMYNIVRRYTPTVEEYSIDECFADITPLRQGYAGQAGREAIRALGEALKEDLKRELGMTFSIGIGPSKVLAKVASKHQKPDGLTIIEPLDIEDFLKQLPISKVWGIGPQTSIKLQNLGIRTALEFVQRNEGWVEDNLARPYTETWHELRGESVHNVNVESNDQKSIQHTRMFGMKTLNKEIILSELSHHVECACVQARRIGLSPKRIYYFIKTAEFRYHRGEIILDQRSTSPSEIMKAIQGTFKGVYRPGIQYRSSGVTLAGLGLSFQNDLFGEVVKSEKSKKVFETVDNIDKRFGSGTMMLGSSVSAHKRRGIHPKRHFKILYMGEVV